MLLCCMFCLCGIIELCGYLLVASGQPLPYIIHSDYEVTPTWSNSRVVKYALVTGPMAA